jgi:Family of unknown function (DUF6516)
MPEAILSDDASRGPEAARNSLILTVIGLRVGKKPRRTRPQLEKRIDQTSYLTGKRRGAILKEEAWFQGNRVVKYSLAYINPRISSADNGRILGYDNTHGQHHHHYRGRTELIPFSSYHALVNRFEREVREIWRREDEEED